MARKYLDDIGMSSESRPENWALDNPRRDLWEKEREIYGFDQRETWGLDDTILIFLYERLMMYKEKNILDLTFHQREYKGKTMNMEEALDLMIEGCRIAVLKHISERNNEDREKVKRVFELLAIWYEELWW